MVNDHISNYILSSSHRRFNKLTGEWVLVSPQRCDRPWQGKVEDSDSGKSHDYDKNCYLCPNNLRASGERNPSYENTYVFKNDFSAIVNDHKNTQDLNYKNILQAKCEIGECRVICFSPKHDLTIAEMENREIVMVINLWIQQYKELIAQDHINHIQIFENKGLIMGCSNPHPHGQIWAQDSIPTGVIKEKNNMELYYETNGERLLEAYTKIEIEFSERVVCKNKHFVAIVPFWATWPFETIIIPLRNVSNISEINNDEILSFAEIISDITIRYDNLFKTSFPYSAGIHQMSNESNSNGAFTMHMHFYPPLLRSATIKKFMVGYEMFGEVQRDITPEVSARWLREQSNMHYKNHHASCHESKNI